MHDEPSLRRDVVLPDLGVGLTILTVWLVKTGERVAAGEPVVEVMTGPATVDLPSPVDGIVVEKHAAEGERLTVGQRLASVACES
ncbi:MAG: biotin/lipoyl-containing protein [Thermoguttaceae bacterium]